jgi:hypothetical protein
MKKATLALTFILTLLVLAVVEAAFVNVATANPGPLNYFPTEPITTPPTIVVHSPIQNETYNSADVWLNFTVTKPEEWFAFNKGSVENGTMFSLAFGNITSVYYTVDGNERQNLTVHDTEDLLVVLSPTLTIDFSTKLTLTEGKHHIRVGLEADSYYVVNLYGPETFSNVEVDGVSEPITFTISKPFPIAPVIAATVIAAVVVSVGLLMHRKRRKEAARA